ncbi:MAG: hypothetical protein MJE12_26115 [Alphaproteobacteria bacterium]|nr:hypothetical protein [Alphaproteobacteria bacterium]
MQLSLTPFLVAVELGFVLVLARRCSRVAATTISMTAVYAYLAWLAAYAVVTSVLGARGVYVSDALLRWLPGLWLQLITVAAFVAPVLLAASLRQGLRAIVDATPLHWFAYFHGLRILAIGTAYKTAIGEFPASFEYIVGIPDLLFGLSAFWVAALVKRGAMGARGFMIWNLVGALVIVPAAPIVLQLGLPGPLQIFTSLPDARAVFTYPMSIAPMIGVPLFVMINLWVAWRLWERGRHPEAVSDRARAL